MRLAGRVSAGALAGCLTVSLVVAGSAPDATAACTTASVLRTWTLRRLAEQTVVVPVNETHVATVAAEVSAGAGGVILFGTSAPSDLGSQLARLVRRAPGGVPPFVMTDEEGGAVARMANLVGSIPSARQMGATLTAAEIHAIAARAGARMRSLGVTMDLAPVLDLDGRPGPSRTNPDGTRSFSPVERVAQRDGLAFADGLRDAGVVPVVKHFPGLGGATGNTDFSSAATLPWSDLETDGLLPFTAAVRGGFPAVMVANARVPGLTALPGSLSWTLTTTVLRGRLGFHGLVLTDSLSAVAIRAAGYTVPAASVRALVAGADMVLFNASATTVAGLTSRVVDAIVAAARGGGLARSRLRNAALHVLRAKDVTLCR